MVIQKIFVYLKVYKNNLKLLKKHFKKPKIFKSIKTNTLRICLFFRRKQYLKKNIYFFEFFVDCFFILILKIIFF